MHFLLVVFKLLLPFLQENKAQSINPSWGPHRKAHYILEKVILHQDYARCSSLDTTYQRRICEIWDEADEASLQRVACSTGEGSGIGHGSTRRLFIPCADGSFNRTCLPDEHFETYICVCQSRKQSDPCPNIYQWDSEWRNIASGRQGLFRQLCDQNTQQCVATEYLLGVAHLVEYIPLPDDTISASSEQDHLHKAKRVRIDNYFDNPCVWQAYPTDPNPYIQFDLLQTYVVIGVLLRARCDIQYHAERTTKFNVQYSLDDATWSYITPLGVYTDYGNTATYTEYTDSFTYFFEEAISGRYWRIIILEFDERKSMKADIIGKV